MRRSQRGNARELSRFASFEAVRVPVICQVGAGRSAEEFPIREWREIRPIRGARPFDRFCAARVSGQSLINDNILDGDYAIIRTNFELYELKPGRLVAALTPYGLLIKHIYVTLDDKVRLVSANSTYEDIVVDASEVEIQGLVVRVERDL